MFSVSSWLMPQTTYKQVIVEASSGSSKQILEASIWSKSWFCSVLIVVYQEWLCLIAQYSPFHSLFRMVTHFSTMSAKRLREPNTVRPAQVNSSWSSVHRSRSLRTQMGSVPPSQLKVDCCSTQSLSAIFARKMFSAVFHAGRTGLEIVADVLKTDAW